jgi:hypothetical protein
MEQVMTAEVSKRAEDQGPLLSQLYDRDVTHIVRNPIDQTAEVSFPRPTPIASGFAERWETTYRLSASETLEAGEPQTVSAELLVRSDTIQAHPDAVLGHQATHVPVCREDRSLVRLLQGA